MSIPASATFLMLLAVIGLQQVLLLLAAPAIENPAYTSQDLWADESAPTAAVRRPRRHDVDEPALCGRHGKHWPGHGFDPNYGFGFGFGYGPRPGFGYGHGHGHGHGHGRGYGHGHGHGHGQGYGSGYIPNIDFDIPAHGNDDNQPQYKVPLAPFNENQQESTELTSSSLAPPTSKTTAAPATTASTTSTTTEDSTLGIDLRSGLS
ncbi:annexin B11 [Drosophila hydei]|uniref:Annexin B11 n=1 Tax=Drosophila hydei TaxID=7224 RepID=A0A6J1LCB2_DROHY|nr:annexin B11 [Drosophila hydei]